MRKSKCFVSGVAILISMGICISLSFAQETINLVTYYPVPFGAYDRIRFIPRNTLGEPCEIGTVYANLSGRLQYCVDDGSSQGEWANVKPGVWTQSGDDIYPADTTSNPNLFVGIGTAGPQNRLDVLGSMVVGSSYAGVETAPTDGLLVEGKVGIGTNSPARALHVAGALHLDAIAQPGVPAAGDLYNDGTDFFFYDGTDWVDLTASGLWQVNGSDIYYNDGNVGIGTNSPRKRLHVQNPAQPTFYMIYDEGKSALRVGRVTGNQWDDANIGLYSTGFGEDVLASGIASVAYGRNATATGTASVAIGDGAQSTSLGAVALGSGTSASGGASVGIGNNAVATASASVAFGYNVTAGGVGSLAMGSDINTSGTALNSVAIGLGAGGATLSQAKTLAIMGGVVGIGLTNPTFALQLPNNVATGTARAFSWSTYSDGRFKTEREPIHDALGLIEQLNPVKYKMLKTKVGRKQEILITDEVLKDVHIGLVAQEVYKVIPEVVLKPDDEKKHQWGISYDNLVPVLIQAVKELKTENEQLKERIESLERVYKDSL